MPKFFSKNQFRPKEVKTTPKYVVLGADSESGLQKILRPTSREILPFFVIFSIVTLFQKIEKKSELAFLLKIIVVLDSFEPFLSISLTGKKISDAQSF